MSTKTDIIWREFSDRETLAENLSSALIADLNRGIDSNGAARLALSGGSTPLPLFNSLARQQGLEWAKVALTLVDERYVAREHSLSNHGFIDQNLLSQLAIRPDFQPLYIAGLTIEQAVDAFNRSDYFACDQGDQLFNSVVLGMGGDGHTASFFPDAPNIAELLSDDNQNRVGACSSPSTQVQRITWLPASLLNTKSLYLHITGADKREVFEQAAASAQ